MSHSRSSWTLYFQPKLIAVLLLGFSSGLPLALTGSTLLTWLPEAGVNITTVGLFAAIGTPYALKFLWSPLIDGMHIPFFCRYLGRRRGWMVFTQIILIISIFGLGASDPSVNPLITAFWALCVAFASASQDIVIDAYRIEILDESQQGAGAAMVVSGYRIGMLVAGAGALILADHVGWLIAYAAMAACMSVGIITVLITGEPKKKTSEEAVSSVSGNIVLRIEKWFTSHVIGPFSDFMKHPAWWLILLFVIFFKFGDAFAGVMTNPFLVTIGFSKTEIATIVKTYGLVATFAGLFLGGVLNQRVGIIPSLWVTGIFQMLSNLMFAVQAKVGYSVLFLSATISIENLAGGMGTAVFVAYLSSLCNVSYTATQYALLSSLAAFGRTWLSASSGWFVSQMGWVHFFILSTAVAVPGLLLLIWMSKVLQPSTIIVQENNG